MTNNFPRQSSTVDENIGESLLNLENQGELIIEEFDKKNANQT